MTRLSATGIIWLVDRLIRPAWFCTKMYFAGVMFFTEFFCAWLIRLSGVEPSCPGDLAAISVATLASYLDTAMAAMACAFSFSWELMAAELGGSGVICWSRELMWDSVMVRGTRVVFITVLTVQVGTTADISSSQGWLRT